MDSRTVIGLLEMGRWRIARVTGSHHHFRHPDRPGTTTVAHPVKDIPPERYAASSGSPASCCGRSRYAPLFSCHRRKSRRWLWGFFPDLPGCTSAGTTVQDAALNAEEALQAHIDLSVEHGEQIPEPSALDRLAVDPDVTEVARILVRAEPPGRAKRVNITIPEDLLAAVDRYAARMG